MENTNLQRHELLKKLQAADFAALELQLYLNTHPCCETAIELFDEKNQEAKQLRAQYERLYGPLTVSSTPKKLPWPWINSPWPWEKYKKGE